jgi:GDP-L-fucose synthase
VLPALMRRFHEAQARGDKSVTIWGTGSPLREFLHVDDMARAVVFLMQHYDGYEHVNVGCGTDLSILELAQKVANAVGFRGEIRTDPTKPDGTPRKLMDVTRLTAMGWSPEISLDQGIAETYRWYLEHEAVARAA